MAEIVTKESPFTPGRPVPIEYFVARIKEIERLERAIKQTSSGRNENIFITGERGIGKSSLAGFVRYLAEKKNFIGSHCFLGGVRDLEGMIRVIFQRILQQITDKSLFDRLKQIFSKYIKRITLFDIEVEFTKDSSELRTLLDNFLPVLRKIHETVKDVKQGIILILDDLNGITDVPEFSQFLKSFVDELATSNNSLPLLLILVGIPERRDDLIKHQPSVARIFDIVDLPPMSKDESTQFFKIMFDKQGISIDQEAISLMIELSGGFPMLMHEVGDAVFWVNTDNRIDGKDAVGGILEAAKNVGKKYLDPQIYRAIGSETYRTILRKISELPLGTTFQRKKILEKITNDERKTFDNFLQRIKKLGIICETEQRGEYRFINQLYHLYVGLEAFGAKKEKKHPNRTS
ncbi:MAG: ATP-binding protein [Nitrospinae bacterium]|nr:ATP-binding protein [Nitrospinota bacterium]